MRTTLTIDDHLALSIKRIAGIRGVPFKTAVNEALRIGIESLENPPRQAPYRTETCSFQLLPGVDPHNLGQVSDELEDMAKIKRSA